ncbi:MAG: DUF975 family protein [Eubacteriales bacterium]
MNNWTRTQLKDRAKEVLRVNYWIALVVGIILIISLGGTLANNSKYTFSKSDYNYQGETTEFDHGFKYEKFDGFNEFSKLNSGIKVFVGIAAAIALVYSIITLGIKIFLFNPLAVGCFRFFGSSAEYPHNNMSPVGYGFKQGNYLKIVGGMLIKNLYLFFWFLLFIIPGIIKSYSYRMVPYILAANPNMGANEAITMSRKMMDGEKWNTFVLDLSFLGWFILGALLFGIGTLFVLPYYYSTDAQLYLAIKEKAIEKNITTPELLNIPSY